MTRDGNAEPGVSMLMFELFWSEWCGRANGFGGPVAPADNKVDAEGDGGGSTTDMSPPARRGIGAVSVTVRGDVDVSAPAVSAALLPVSDCSSGMVTLRRGREAPPVFDCMLLERDGGVNVVSGTVETE